MYNLSLMLLILRVFTVTTFKQLESFVSVVDLGSFEKAARSLETSQSNISRQIASFEASFAVPQMDYIALVRIDAISDLHRSVAKLAREQCDFAIPFYG